MRTFVVLLCLIGLSCQRSVAPGQQEFRIVVTTGENEKDRLTRYQLLIQHLEKKLGRKIIWRVATDYAAVIEAVRARQVEVAFFGPASYAKAWLVTDGKVRPILCLRNKDGSSGSHSVIVVRKDSPYQTVADLKDKSIAFADPNSTTGFVAPTYFLTKEGIELDKHFGRTGFSGSHENGLLAVLNKTYDAACTAWYSEGWSTIARMEEKKMIEPGLFRVIWKSPQMPNGPWAAHQDVDPDLIRRFRETLLALPRESPEAWERIRNGYDGGYLEVTHERYQQIVEMIQANSELRRKQ